MIDSINSWLSWLGITNPPLKKENLKQKKTLKKTSQNPTLKDIYWQDLKSQLRESQQYLENNKTSLPNTEKKLLYKIHELVHLIRQPTRNVSAQLNNILKLISKNKENLKDFNIDPIFFKVMVRMLLLTQDPSVIKKRSEFFSNLYQIKYFSIKEHIKDAFNFAFENHNPLAFKDLLSFKNILPNAELLDYRKRFESDDLPNLFCLNLFPLLYPEEYENKKWRDLNSYEKLYWLVFDEYQTVKLSHRIGLKGKIESQWRGQNFQSLGLRRRNDQDGKIELEGQVEGRSLIQFKQSLLLFQSSRPQTIQIVDQALQKTIEKIADIEPQVEHRFKHRLKNAQNHIYIFPFEDEHATTGYHTVDGYYYQINMGFLSKSEPGIHIYKVPEHCREFTHAQLTNLQYNHQTKHLYDVPNRCGLIEIGFLKLPGQPSGNCTYESLKGLFCAILFDELRKEYSFSKALRKTLGVYRSFCEYDIHDAIYDYTQHSLCVNKNLLTKAYALKDKILEKQVFNDFTFYLETRDSKSRSKTYKHNFTPSPERYVSLKCL